MKEHEKRCKVTAGQGISFPPKRKASGSNPLRNVRESSQALDLQGVWLFSFSLNVMSYCHNRTGNPLTGGFSV